MEACKEPSAEDTSATVPATLLDDVLGLVSSMVEARRRLLKLEARIAVLDLQLRAGTPILHARAQALREIAEVQCKMLQHEWPVAQQSAALLEGNAAQTP